jgi:hypothetical protein
MRHRFQVSPPAQAQCVCGAQGKVLAPGKGFVMAADPQQSGVTKIGKL